MSVDFVFPGSIILLKTAFKLALEQEVKAVDCFKAFLSLPVDIAFLSFSFGAAILYSIQTNKPHEASVKITLLFFVVCTILSLVVSVLAKKSDKAFDKEKNEQSLAFAFFGYAFSISSLLGSFYVERLV